jgi:hypothetical protein
MDKYDALKAFGRASILGVTLLPAAIIQATCVVLGKPDRPLTGILHVIKTGYAPKI